MGLLYELPDDPDDAEDADGLGLGLADLCVVGRAGSGLPPLLSRVGLDVALEPEDGLDVAGFWAPEEGLDVAGFWAPEEGRCCCCCTAGFVDPSPFGCGLVRCNDERCRSDARRDWSVRPSAPFL